MIMATDTEHMVESALPDDIGFINRRGTDAGMAWIQLDDAFAFKSSPKTESHCRDLVLRITGDFARKLRERLRTNEGAAESPEVEDLVRILAALRLRLTPLHSTVEDGALAEFFFVRAQNSDEELAKLRQALRGSKLVKAIYEKPGEQLPVSSES
jgi:hypothetical protein